MAGSGLWRGLAGFFKWRCVPFDFARFEVLTLAPKIVEVHVESNQNRAAVW